MEEIIEANRDMAQAFNLRPLKVTLVKPHTNLMRKLSAFSEGIHPISPFNSYLSKHAAARKASYEKLGSGIIKPISMLEKYPTPPKKKKKRYRDIDEDWEV